MSERPAHESEDVEIVDAHDAARLDDVRTLLRAYAASVTREEGGAAVLHAQDFEGEMAALPGDYVPPHGLLLIALVDGAPSGCIALRPLEGDVAEMKRLFVHPERRGMSLGFKLVDRLLERARGLGYARVRLDTLPFMRNAVRLYRAFDFEEIAPYREPVLHGSRYFERTLDGI